MSERDRSRWEGVHARRPSADTAPAAFLVEHADLLSPGRTLDLAAGSGRNALFLAARGHRVLAADIAGAALRRIRERNPAVDVVQVDLDRPCFRAASFDNVLCINFLDRRLLSSMVEWLRPGGGLLVDTFLIDQREIGHPRDPAFLLAHNELLERMRDVRVLRYREGTVTEESATSHRAGIVARRPPAKN